MAPSASGTSKYVDFDKMVSSMSREINSFWSLYGAVDDGNKICPIYRVPEHIRGIDRDAYEPMVVSFGPYHHGTQHLQVMEKDKWKHLNRVLKLNGKMNLHNYIKEIAALEKQARKCYSEEVKMERKKFLQMLLLDACFLLVNIDENVGTSTSNTSVLDQSSIERTINENTTEEDVVSLRQSACAVGYSKSREHGHPVELEMIKVESSQGKTNIDKDVNHTPNVETSNKVGDWLCSAAWHDIFLLENQIPFFILEKIYELVAGQGTGVEFLRSKTSEFVEDILSHYPKAIQEFDRPKHFHHLLHLCHIYFRPSQRTAVELQCQPKRRYFSLLHFGYKRLPDSHKPVDADKNLEQMDCFRAGKLRTRWRRAVEYHQAGVHFKRREYEHSRHSLLDIRFMNGVIEVPCLPIDESSESLFKNLLALEQMDPRFGNDISAYITFMSQVIATPDDATLLVQRGIIVHMLDNEEEVSALFTRLTKQVTFRFDCKYYLKYLCQTLEVHYQSRLNRWIAWLWFNHFGNPWMALAALAAVVVLVCTIVQTIYTVLAYVKPPSDI